MKKLIYFYIFCAVLIIFSCETKQPKEPNVDFTGKGYIKLFNTSSDSLLDIQVSYIDLLQQRIISFDNLKLSMGDSSVYTFPLFFPSRINLSISSHFYKLFLTPNDTLNLFIEGDSNKYSLKYLGENELSKINYYYENKENIFRNDFDKAKSNLFLKRLSPQIFKTSIDSLTEKEVQLINNYARKHKLPNWFINYEQSNSIYSSLHFKNIFKSWNKTKINRNLNVDASYYNYLENISIDNDKAKFNSIYYYFLFYYLNNNFETDTFIKIYGSNKNVYNFLKNNFLLADSLLSNEIKDIYKFRILYHSLKGEYKNGAYKFLREKQCYFQNKKFNNYLYSLIDNDDYKVEGKSATNFYLQDEEGKTFTFNQFKGNVVLLDFFAPGCQPCINEISYEKEIVAQFKKDNFIFISICFSKDFDTFVAFQNKYDKAGIHLYANNNWRSILTNKYQISGYPHYVLINKAGIIVENNCRRPSHGVNEDILKLLN